MNIFILDEDLEKCAQYHCDKHVVKMQVEYAQMLSAAVRLSGIDAGYRITHKNHPCTKWVCESVENWLYLYKLLLALHTEWKLRYKHPWDRKHKSVEMALSLPTPKLPVRSMTPFAQAMPDKYKHTDAITAYRQYYIGDKQHLATWKNREKPEWYK